MFLVTTSGIHSSLSGRGVMSSNGVGAFNIGCNVNGTCDVNGTTGILMDTREGFPVIPGGGYYTTGKLSMVRSSSNRVSYHTLNSFGHTQRSDQGGVYTAVRGSVTVLGSDTLITNGYLGGGAGYQTVFKDFVQGITEDQHGVLGNMYDVDTSLWVVPWVLSDHYDHPSMLRAMPHYMAFENGDVIPSILGDITVVTASYPVFMEIAYTDNGDGTDSFTYRVLDTTYTEIIEGVVIVLEYPFQARSETSVIFDSEVIDADDNNPLSYFLGDPFFFLRQSPVSFEINWLGVDQAEFYRLTSELDGQGEILLASDITDTKVFVQNLTPETAYTMRLFVRTVGSSEYVLTYTTTAVTNANEAENYAPFVEDIQDETTGIFDLSNTEPDQFALLEDIIEDIFDDGSSIAINVEVNGVSQDILTTFVHKGSSVSVEGTDALLTSFNDDSIDQFIEIETVDGNQRLDYDPVSKTFTFEGVVYNIGDSITAGGRRLEIFDS